MKSFKEFLKEATKEFNWNKNGRVQKYGKAIANHGAALSTKSLMQKYKDQVNAKIASANANSDKQKLKEEVAGGTATPSNNIGSGNIAGSGGLGGEPGVKKKKKNSIVALIKRKGK